MATGKNINLGKGEGDIKILKVGKNIKLLYTPG